MSRWWWQTRRSGCDGNANSYTSGLDALVQPRVKHIMQWALRRARRIRPCPKGSQLAFATAVSSRTTPNVRCLTSDIWHSQARSSGAVA